MSEDPAERARTYLNSTEEALKLIAGLNNPNVLCIVDYVRRYVADAKYFLQTGKATTALASVAYAEGLLDSLTILGLADSKRATS